jgi:hypothetical protein
MVLRVGVAIPKCFNLPLTLVAGAELRRHAGGHGDIALTMSGPPSFGYGLLWPHARPWRMREPQPMLRAIPDAEMVAARLTGACAAILPVDRDTPVALTPAAAPQLVGAAA